jgi:hypothetical protein
MADAKKAPVHTEPVKAKKRGKLAFYTTIILLIAIAPFIIPTLELLLAGMLPTLVALFTDNDREHSSATAVGAMNFAGTTPFLIDLWMKGQNMGNVTQILAQPSNWLVMYGAAGVGLLIVFAVPQAIASLTFARSEVRLKILKENMEKLKATWGLDVATTKPLNQIGKVD